MRRLRSKEQAEINDICNWRALEVLIQSDFLCIGSDHGCGILATTSAMSFVLMLHQVSCLSCAEEEGDEEQTFEVVQYSSYTHKFGYDHFVDSQW